MHLNIRGASGWIATLVLSCAVLGCGASGAEEGSGGMRGSGSGGRDVGSGGSGSGGVTGSGGAMLGSGGSGSGGASGSGGVTGAGGSGAAAGGSGSGGTAAGGMSGGGGPRGGAGGSGQGGSAGSGAKGGAGGAGAGGSSGAFTLTSPNHMDGAHFDAKYTCASMNGQLMTGANPDLVWSGAPAGTKSFAITFIDTTLGETSPLGQHWAIWNIPAAVNKFPEATTTLNGELMSAKQSGRFFAPCAQSLQNGMNDQYEFTIYALPNETLNVSGMSVANCLAALKMATPLATAKLRGHAGLKGQ